MEGNEQESAAEIPVSDDAMPNLASFATASPTEQARDGHAPRPATWEMPIDSQPWHRHLFGAMGSGLLFALVGLVIAARLLAVYVLPHILRSGEGINYAEVTDGLPVPHLLAWNLESIEWLVNLRDASGPWLLLVALALFGILWATTVTVLNPTFSLFHTAEQGYAKPTQSRVKTLVALFLMGLVVALLARVSQLTTYLMADNRKVSVSVPDVPPLSGAFWLMLLGCALWVVLHQQGVIGDFVQRVWNPLGSALPNLLLTGAGYGLILYALLRWATPQPLNPLLDSYQMLGTFNRSYAHAIGGRYLFSVLALWFAAGALLYAIGRPYLARRLRGGLLLLPVAATLLALLAQQPFAPKTLASRLDITPQIKKTIVISWQPRYPGSGVPDGPLAGKELAARTGLQWSSPDSKPPERNFLLFSDQGVFTARQSLRTEDGLSADPATAAPVQDYLRRYDYQTTLSWVAIKHLFNLGTTRFDPHAALQSMLLDMTHCPHLTQSSWTAYAMFYICNTSPQNLALLDQYGDENLFAHPDRNSQRRMGDLYARFGAMDKALAWYRRAEMPQTFMKRVQATKPLFRQGHITGTLRLDGKPLAGMPVAVLPHRLNGLPARMEQIVYEAEWEITGLPTLRSPTWAFAQGRPRPFAFRWLSAGTTTDANGAFSLDNLTEGEYFLVVALPPEIQAEPGASPLPVRNAPAPIELNYASPTSDLGTIDLATPTGMNLTPRPPSLLRSLRSQGRGRNAALDSPFPSEAKRASREGGRGVRL